MNFLGIKQDSRIIFILKIISCIIFPIFSVPWTAHKITKEYRGYIIKILRLRLSM
jgi:hypothetical protein